MKRLLIFTAIMVLVASCSATHSRQEASRGASIPLITFVFDDGDDTDYLVGKKLFAKQGVVACSAVTTGWINTKNHLTPAQITALRDSGWEIMSHTVSHPNLRSLTPDEVDAELFHSKAELENMGLTVNNLVYPFNMNNEMVRNIASKYYRSGRGGTSSFNAGSIDPYFLKSFSMKHDIPRMKEHIDRAYAESSWLIFYQHEIDIKVKLSDKQGTFTEGETLTLSPSGAVGRYVTVHWFPIYGFAMYLVPFSGTPQPGDLITGSMSGATARVDTIIYDEPAQLTELIRYIQTRYPDMRIVTVDQGLDLLGVPKLQNSVQKHEEGKMNSALK
jgi:peptidoglycan/xylan/chitin deacetylase (PgdA/CDA1 family)